MNTPETINIEKYAEALNNLVGMDIGYLGESDENVNAIAEVIRAAKALENRVKELEADNKKWQERLDREAKCQYDLAGQIVDLKSRVDLYRRLNDELEDELASTYDKLENAKAESAREIFEDIEKVFEPTVSALFLISETLVDVSKLHIDADRAIIDIRKYLSKAICSRYQFKKVLEEPKKKYIGGNDNE